MQKGLLTRHLHRSLLTFLLIFTFSFVFKESKANAIDSLKSNKDVEEFVNKLDTNSRFIVPEMEEINKDSSLRDIAEAIGLETSWQKIDLDNNGLTDLLFFGDNYGWGTTFVVMDDNGIYKLHSFRARDFAMELLMPSVSMRENQPILILYTIVSTDLKRWVLKDTARLVYKFNSFIELNNDLKAYNIQKIEYSTTQCFGSCPVFQINIKSNRRAKYKAIMFNKKHGTYRTRIDASQFNEIVRILNYIDFPNLKTHYTIPVTDVQECTLIITYNNGLKKEITDYGLVGSYGLIALYNKLFELRENQNW